MIAALLEKLTRREDLGRDQAREVMRSIMSGALSDPQVAAILIALRTKGETVEEITGFVSAMREKSVTIPLRSENAVDTCGTGGDAPSTFNISTATAFVAAGMGVTVAKHGNRAVSSSCGSADVLETLGVNIGLTPAQGASVIEQTGIGFLFAPSYHPAMKHAAPARRELGMRTVFNVLGPLTNPAGVKRQLVGVYNPELTETVARVLGALGSTRVYAVHGEDGSDEVSICGTTRVSELKDGEVRTYEFDPRSLGMMLAIPGQITGGTPEENASLLQGVLDGRKGPRRDVVVLNAAFTAMVAGQADSVEEGIARANQSINSGAAARKLDKLRSVSHKIAAS
jgi:anthranilate phosphoribosyltransferase